MSKQRSSQKKHTFIQTPLTFARYTAAHPQHPERNEDTVLVDQRRGLAVVCDGVGGDEAGELASQMAARTVHEGWKQVVKRYHKQAVIPLVAEFDLAQTLEQLVEEARAKVSELGAQKQAQQAQEIVSYPGTTLVLAALCQRPGAAGYQLGHVHVGDSRLYLWRATEPLQRLTQDDSYLTLKVADGTLSEQEALRIDQATRFEELNDLARSYFVKRNGITQALQHPNPYLPEKLTIHVEQRALLPGDRLLLCSDGIHDNLTDVEIADILQKASPTTVARQLVQKAQERSKTDTLRAKADDMSAIVVTCHL